ncbi:MAG: MFS transporter [Propionibacteriaceae bacterium]
MNVTTTGLTRTERLDRLPFNRRHGRLIGGSGIGWALDAMDVGLISFVLAALKVQWDLTNGEMSWIASIGFVGMAIGASLGGLLADKIGRRQVFALTLLIYGLATGASALAGSVAVLLVFRFLVGLGLGAELPVASTLVSEYAPAKIRGRLVVILEAFWAVGWVLAALIGYFVVPLSDNGWRWALAIGAVPAVYAIVVRLGLPESVRFLERKGRTEEAETAVRAFEQPSGIAPVESPTVEPVASPGPGALWGRGMRRRTAAIWLAWFFINFAYYGAFIWLPSILVADGYSLVKSFGFTLLITLAQLPGYALAAFLIEVWGRRPTLASFLGGSAVAAGLFAFAGGESSILVAGMLLSFFNLGAWGALYAVTPEIYPTVLRGTGTGWAAGFGRIASIIAPLLMPAMLAAGGRELAFLVFGVAFLAAMVAAFNLPEMRGQALTEVEQAT